jgi:hypothetical protein
MKKSIPLSFLFLYGVITAISQTPVIPRPGPAVIPGVGNIVAMPAAGSLNMMLPRGSNTPFMMWPGLHRCPEK